MLINRIKGKDLAEFIKEWDKPPIEPHSNNSASNLRESHLGNINVLGKASCAEATLFTKHHPNFFDSIETKIKDLVICIVNDLHCITFSSCQGHPEYFDKSEQTLIEYRQREISILPRNEKEHSRLLHFFLELAHETNAAISNARIQIEVNEEILEQQLGPIIKEWTNISISFASSFQNSNDYFENLEPVYLLFLTKLKNQDAKML